MVTVPLIVITKRTDYVSCATIKS